MSLKISPRESVIMATDFKTMVAWYTNVLGLKLVRLFEDHYNYAYLVSETGIRIGIADAKEMGVDSKDRKNNSVVLQFEVKNVQEFFDYLKENGGTATFGPSHDKEHDFWYGGFTDIEGNPFWVVDEKCP